MVAEKKKSPLYGSLTSGGLFRCQLNPHTSGRCQTFRLVADAGLEACLEEGLAAVFLAALAGVDLLSGDFFALDAGVLEVGFFPVTSWIRREN